MRLALVKRLLVGVPMPLAQARHERLSKTVALAVFASDPLSSVAYATEEILLVLMLGGTAALSYSLPVAMGIAALLAVVVISYRQTVAAYPQGGPRSASGSARRRCSSPSCRASRSGRRCVASGPSRAPRRTRRFCCCRS